MNIRGLIPRNSTEMAEAVPIEIRQKMKRHEDTDKQNEST